jgi:adenylate cyclase
MTETRKLAAILAADVVGYSRLASVDEDRILARLRALRSDLVDPTIAVHNGRVVKRTGDGSIVEFRSVVDAVRCAIEVQNAMVERNAGVPDDRRIVFRIGIHLGDVVEEADGDLMGDGVNIAARLEGVANPGAISLSEDAYRQVKGRLDLAVTDLGPTQLKNIAEPIRVYSLQVGVPAPAKPIAPVQPAAPERPSAHLALPDKPSIAVLPFTNMSGDPEQDYFADGMADDIITALSRFKSLFVIARNSSFTYKGRAVDIKQVGHELGVRYVLEGSVRKASGHVRITGQLIEAATGTHLWADKFDGDLEDVFQLQDRVTASVVGTIAPYIERAEIERSTQKPAQHLVAYDYFLRGLEKQYIPRQSTFAEAEDLFRKAIVLDERFAQPYAALALSRAVRRTYLWPISAAEVEEGVRLGEKAVALDRDDAFVLARAGYAYAMLGRDFETGRALFEDALRRNPNQAIAWTWDGWAKVWFGEHERSLESFQTSMRLSPLEPFSFVAPCGMAAALFLLGRHKESWDWVQRASRIYPDFTATKRVETACLVALGKTEEAAARYRAQKDFDLAVQSAHAFRTHTPYQRGEDLNKFISCYRVIGMPE